MRSRRTAAMVAAGVTAVPVTAVLPAVAPDEAAAGTSHDRLERAIVREINVVRSGAGVRAVRPSRALARAASRHSRSQIRNRRMTHGAMGSRVRRYTSAATVGETIAWLPGRARAARIVSMWMHSPPHRAELLSRTYVRVGVGRRTGRLGGHRGTIVTADFASG